MEESKFWRTVVQVEEVTETPLRKGQHLDEHQMFLGCDRSFEVIQRNIASLAHVEDDVDDLCQRAALMRWQLADPIRSFNRILEILREFETEMKRVANRPALSSKVEDIRIIAKNSLKKIKDEHGLNTSGGLPVSGVVSRRFMGEAIHDEHPVKK